MLLIGDHGDGPSGDERRRAPRIQLMGAVSGHLLPREFPVHVLEVGLGGFSIESPQTFLVGAVHTFQLALPDGSTFLIRGRVAHCRQDIDGDDASVHVAGFAFVDELPGGNDSDELVDRLTSVVRFD